MFTGQFGFFVNTLPKHNKYFFWYEGIKFCYLNFLVDVNNSDNFLIKIYLFISFWSLFSLLTLNNVNLIKPEE